MQLRCWAIYNDLSRRVVTPQIGGKGKGIPPKYGLKNQVKDLYCNKLILQIWPEKSG